MAVTSAMSAELIAVSTICTYDIYKVSFPGLSGPIQLLTRVAGLFRSAGAIKAAHSSLAPELYRLLGLPSSLQHRALLCGHKASFAEAFAMVLSLTSHQSRLALPLHGRCSQRRCPPCNIHSLPCSSIVGSGNLLSSIGCGLLSHWLAHSFQIEVRSH